MKQLILLLSLITLPFCLLAQNAYYDALYLAKYTEFQDGQYIFPNTNNTVEDSVMAILTKSKYFPALTDDPEMITQTIQKNPFFSNFIYGGEGRSLQELRSITIPGIPSISGLNVTTAVEGISLFMVSRAKEELNVTFFRRFKAFIDENSEIQTLFPRTTESMNRLVSYQYPEMFSTLRTAFNEDLQNLHNHIDDVLTLPVYRDLINNFPEMRAPIELLRHIRQLASAEIHADSIITRLAKMEELDHENGSLQLQNIGNILKLANIFSKSLRYRPDTNPNQTRAWISGGELLELTRDETALRIYLGLIYQEVLHENIHFTMRVDDRVSQLNLTDVMEEHSDQLFMFKNRLTKFIEYAERVDQVRQDIDQMKLKNEQISHSEYLPYLTHSLNLMEYSTEMVTILHEDFIKTDHTELIRQVIGIIRNIYKEQYGSAIVNGKEIFRLTIEMVKENNRSGNESYSSALDQLENFEKILPDLTRYGLFITNVVQAESPAEVNTAIEAAVLPVGSSSIKKNSAFNIGIQSYLGGYRRIGQELVAGGSRSWRSDWGMIAPIGVSFNLGFGKSGSPGVFVPLIDIGAIVDYNLTTESENGEETTSLDHKIELGQIFAPGAYVTYGFPNYWPVSFGIGGQLGPGLSGLNADDGSIINKPAWRWNIFISVDIPFINLYTKQRY